MEYTIYKLEFPYGAHFGQKNLEDGNYVFCADTLFSALCQESLHWGEEKLKWLYDTAKNGRLCFSDGLPYIGDTYYIPKPLLRIEKEKNGNSKEKKAFKKLAYLPVNLLDVYLQGDLNIAEEKNLFSELGKSVMKTSVSIRGEEETKPYRVGIYEFQEDNGLCVLVGYEEKKDLEQLEELLKSLSYSGIGGKRYAGLGRFSLTKEELPVEFKERLQKDGSMYMTLSVSLPREDELEKVLEDGRISVVKRSGFVASSDYAGEYLRKRDLFVFQSGSCVRQIYEGDIYDVSAYGNHPVYRYAKPIFLEVGR